MILYHNFQVRYQVLLRNNQAFKLKTPYKVTYNFCKNVDRWNVHFKIYRKNGYNGYSTLKTTLYLDLF